MDDLAKRSIEQFLDELASRTPTPGGGSVAALAGALACAMARMVAAYTTNKNSEPAALRQNDDVLRRLQRADQLLRALITQDAISYANMTATRKAAKQDPKRQPEYQEAVLQAIGTPLEIAAAMADTLATLDEFKAGANRYLLSDLGVAAVLADAAAQAASFSVKINLPAVADAEMRDKILEDTEACLQRCANRRSSIDEYVHGQIEECST